MSVPTLPHLNGPRARGFACKPLRYEACASSLSHARSITQQPARPSAYTVPGRARDFHPHSLKRARSSPTPASCPTQPSLPITPGFYHDSHAHVQKRPRMWHSSAVSTYAAVDIFHFPSQRAVSADISASSATQCQKRANMPHSSPFLYKSLDQLASNNIHPRSISSTRRFQQCSAQATPLMHGIQYGSPKSIPYARARYPIPRASPPRQKKPPHKRGAAFYKTMRSFNRAWVQPSQAFDQERARREIYSAASSVAGFSALGAAAFFLGWRGSGAWMVSSTSTSKPRS